MRPSANHSIASPALPTMSPRSLMSVATDHSRSDGNKRRPSDRLHANARFVPCLSIDPPPVPQELIAPADEFGPPMPWIEYRRLANAEPAAIREIAATTIAAAA